MSGEELHLPHRAGVREGQDRLATALRDDRAPASRDLGERVVPRSKRPSPLAPTRRSGVSTRSGECTRSAYSRTLPQMMPCVNGCSAVPATSAMRPLSTLTSRLQQDGQSWGHTECMRGF
jgi:hypothetical protein